MRVLSTKLELVSEFSKDNFYAIIRIGGFFYFSVDY